MRHFTPPARTSCQLALDPLTPAGYLTLRRTAAGITRAQLARALVTLAYNHRALTAGRPTVAEDAARFAEARNMVDQLETKGVRARRIETLTAIASIMPFDPAVYGQLAGEPAERHPRICRGCGCSGHDACVDAEESVCHWITPAVCSHCIDRGIAASEFAR